VGLPDPHTDPLVSGTNPRIRSNNPNPVKKIKMKIFFLSRDTHKLMGVTIIMGMLPCTGKGLIVKQKNFSDHSPFIYLIDTYFK
jgi:hypothetical protein